MCIGEINKVGNIHFPALILLHCLWWTIQKPTQLAITKPLLLIYQWIKIVAWNFAAYSINFAKNRLPHIEHAFIWNRLRGRWFVDNENRKFFEVLLFVSFPNLQILRRFYWGQQKFYHTELKRLFQGILVINSVTLLLQIRIHSATRNILLSPSWVFYVRKKHSS